MRYPARVYFTQMAEAQAWAKENCQSYCNDYKVYYNDLAYFELLFTDEQDAILARMRWS